MAERNAKRKKENNRDDDNDTKKKKKNKNDNCKSKKAYNATDQCANCTITVLRVSGQSVI